MKKYYVHIQETAHLTMSFWAKSKTEALKIAWERFNEAYENGTEEEVLDFETDEEVEIEC